MQKQNLSQKMLQKLSPQQIQLMKLLQIPTALLDQRIQEELEENPALELDEITDHAIDTEESDFDSLEDEESYIISTDGKKEKLNDDESDDLYAEDQNERLDDFSIDDFGFQDQEFQRDAQVLDEYLGDYMEDDQASYKLDVNNYNADEEDKEIPFAMEQGFLDSLEQQLGMLGFNERELTIAHQIIGNIDEDGYLRRDISALTDDLLFSENLNCSENEVESVLNLLHKKMDPPGVGARDLQECLKIQLERKIASEEVMLHYDRLAKKNLKLAYRIITDYFEEFSKKHYPKLLKQLNLFSEDLKDISAEIIKLNPKPGSLFQGNSERRYIVPDFIIENNEGNLELTLNAKNAPELRISDQYRSMLETYQHNKNDKKAKEAALFVKQKMDAAKWFIDAIKQRQDTLLKSMYTIMMYQEEYFKTGDEKKLKPMILKDIAEITGLDISTVSRVANSKYVLTEFGTKKLKDFFSESLQTDSGEEVSTLEVKKIIQEIISAENPKNPFADEKLMEILLKKGYNIARRTVAKYREQLGIPVARLRKGI